jgi:hypothetical protein
MRIPGERFPCNEKTVIPTCYCTHSIFIFVGLATIIIFLKK